MPSSTIPEESGKLCNGAITSDRRIQRPRCLPSRATRPPYLPGRKSRQQKCQQSTDAATTRSPSPSISTRRKLPRLRRMSVRLWLPHSQRRLSPQHLRHPRLLRIEMNTEKSWIIRMSCLKQTRWPLHHP